MCQTHADMVDTAACGETAIRASAVVVIRGILVSTEVRYTLTRIRSWFGICTQRVLVCNNIRTRVRVLSIESV